MENNDLGSKKMNNKQETISTNNPSASAPPLQSEIETNAQGEESVVQRARHMDHNIPLSETHPLEELSANPSEAPEVAGKKMVENKDKNSDITSNRYPNSNLDNHTNRGNA